jgi:hypothetical protein
MIFAIHKGSSEENLLISLDHPLILKCGRPIEVVEMPNVNRTNTEKLDDCSHYERA